MPGRRTLPGLVAALIALPGVAFAAGEPAKPRVAILVVSPDPLTAGRLQLEMEKRLVEADRVTLVTARDSAFRVGKEDRGGPPPRTDDREILDLMNGARNDYFEDELVRAIKQLDTVAERFEKQGRVAVEDEVDLHLWRAAVHLGLGETEPAQEEALAALTLSPGLEVDRAIFPPSVERLFSTVRDGLKMAVVKVKTYPPGAWVEVDDRQVQPEFSLPAGTHRVVVSAPGFHPVERQIKLERYLELMVSLPIALDARFERTLLPAVQKGKLDLPASTLMTYLAGRLDVQGVVLIAADSRDGARRGFVWWSGSSGRSSPAVESEMGEVILQNWSVTMLQDYAARRPDLRPTFWDGWKGQVRAGAALSSRHRVLAGDGGRVSASFVGAGPRLDIEGGRRGVWGELSYEYLDASFSRTSQRLADGSVGFAHGGTSSFFRLGAGYRLHAEDADAPWTVGTTLGFFVAEHRAQDISGVNGPVGYFTSYQWLGPDLRLRGQWRFPVRIWGEPTLHGRVTVAPVSRWRENPTRTTGFSPQVEPAWSWGVGVVFTPRDRWEVSADFSDRQSRVRLSGEASAAVDPAVPIQSARITEAVNTLTISVHRVF